VHVQFPPADFCRLCPVSMKTGRTTYKVAIAVNWILAVLGRTQDASLVPHPEDEG
jgi:hypothetical protein